MEIVNPHLQYDGFIRTPRATNAIEYILHENVQVNTVLDVGIGVNTWFLQKTLPDKKHILFEPLLEYKDRCEEDYTSKGLDYELYNIALSDHIDANGNLFFDKVPGRDFIWAGVVPPDSSHYQGDEHDTRKMNIDTLDNFLSDKDYPKPYYLKVDVDGQEMKVMHGAIDTLRDCSVVQLEASLHGQWSVEQGRPMGSPIWESIQWFQDRGFQLWDIVDQMYLGGKLWQVDVIFVNRKDYDRIHLEHVKKDKLANQRIDEQLKIRFI